MISAADLRKQYLALLDGNHDEQVYQTYLEENTRLIPREFIQNHGVHCCTVLRKLGLANDYKSDFFFFSKSSDDWHAIHIEIEKPQLPFFLKNTTTFSPSFNTALQQVNTWRAWFTLDNQRAFLQSLQPLLVPHHMATNPTSNKYVLVYGRRGEYEGNAVRRRLIHGLEREDFRIITFDSLAEDLEHKHDLYVGVRHNTFIDIQTDEIVDPGLFGWVEPTQLRVSKVLHDKLANGPASQFFLFKNNQRIDACKYAAAHVMVR